MSYLQFKNKEFLLNNAYILASKKEREEMNANKEMKRPHYRQSGIVFLFLEVACAFFAAYCFFDYNKRLFIAFGIVIFATLIYAIVSSIKRNKKTPKNQGFLGVYSHFIYLSGI